MEKDQLTEARRLAALLEDRRRDWVGRWEETARWIAPWRGRFNGACVSDAFAGSGFDSGGADRGQGRSPHIFDSTATRALRILAAGLQSGLTSPARPWFRLRRGGDRSAESGPERRWLDVVEEALYAAFAGSNFYQAVHNLYTELAIFGSADMYMETDPERHLRFSTLTCGEFSWACDASGRVDTVLRRMRLTPRQMVQLWGQERLCGPTRQKLVQNPDSPVEVLHLVRPRGARNPARSGKRHMPYASLVWEEDAQAGELLHEGGYEEFPHLCARWDVLGGEVYGRSPAMETLPDVRMLQEMTKSQLLAIHKVVNPPMRVPAGFKQRLSLIPGAINYINPNQPEGIGPLYQINPDIPALTRKIEDVREAVRQGFFNDLFLMFTAEGRSNVTAAEIMERGQEKLLMLGPVIERHQTEILDPLLVRAFGIVNRAGLLPPPPLSLRGQDLRVEYVSALAQAQRTGGAEAIRRLTGEVSGIAAIAPEVLDKIDFEQAVDELASMAGVPARIVRSDAEVRDLRRAREREATPLAEAEEDPPLDPKVASIASMLGAGLSGEGGGTDAAGLDKLLAAAGRLLPGLAQKPGEKGLESPGAAALLAALGGDPDAEVSENMPPAVLDGGQGGGA